MARKIIWSLPAQEDKKLIFTYWNKRTKSKAYSRKLNSLFKAAVRLLRDHPHIGRRTTLDNINIKVVRDYLIIYEVTENTITVHTIWNSRRNPDDLGVS